MTLLMVCAECNFNDFAKYLIKEAGADISKTDHYGQKAIHYAAKTSLPSFEELVYAGADAEAEDSHGKTPLMHACEYGNVEVVEFILRMGVDISKRDTYDRDARYYATKITDETKRTRILSLLDNY